MYSSFRPGKIWYDTNGKRIQAHGGSILFAEGKYWWYGENKEGIRGKAMGEPCPNWHHGVKLYSSDDLYNWKDEGFLMSESSDKTNPFYPTAIMDRPHVIYNRNTRKYVLWAKTCNGGGFDACKFSICVGDSLQTMRYVKDVCFDGLFAGDLDIFEADGKAYVVYENPHTCMILQELTADYTDLSPVYSKHLEFGAPPCVREAPAYFERNGRRYLLTSGTTGYFPNRTICYDITDLHGEWKELGEPCVNDTQHNSFHAQFSSVFRHPSRSDTYIALGDRWLTDLSVNIPDMEQVFLGFFQPPKGIRIDGKEADLFTEQNTEEANYVWLPISFRADGTPYIEWKHAWTL